MAVRERTLLQIAVAVAALVPIGAGLAGALGGAAFPGWLDGTAFEGRALDSHVRYLSGLLFGIGAAFFATVPGIGKHRVRFTLLTLIVAGGGLARLAGIAVSGVPHRGMLFGLAMELIVTPLLWAWQRRIAAKCEQARD